MSFARMFPDYDEMADLARQVTWTHIRYSPGTQVRRRPPASTRRRLHPSTSASVSCERLLLAKPSSAARSRTPRSRGSAVPRDTFRDPLILDTLGLHDSYLERDLEAAILRDVQAFLLEVGHGFAFVASQKRMTIDGDDFYLDLLFFSRPLRRLVAVELKIGKFDARFEGQMKLYLKWLDRYERQEHEEAPVGLILCTEVSREQVELLEMHRDGIVVAEYWTVTSSKGRTPGEAQPRSSATPKSAWRGVACRLGWTTGQKPRDATAGYFFLETSFAPAPATTTTTVPAATAF